MAYISLFKFRHHYACSFNSIQDIRSIYRGGTLLESLESGGSLILSEDVVFMNKNPSGLSSAINVADVRIWRASLESNDLSK